MNSKQSIKIKNYFIENAFNSTISLLLLKLIAYIMNTIGGVSMDYQKVGFLIAELRKEKGLTQRELASKLGITDRAVSKWERGLGCPDVSLLDDLSRILEISILEILKGRRLDKDEIVNNRSMIESMNYSKASIKYKIKRYFNIISIGLIIIICLIIMFSNLRSIYYLNKTYHNNFEDGANAELSTEVKTNMDLIKSKQGIYSDKDYAEILKYIDDLEKNLNEQNNLYYYSKEAFTYEDIAKFYVSHPFYSYAPINPNDMIYKIIHEYNPNVVDNMILYYRYSDMLVDSYTRIGEQLSNPYDNKKISNNIVSSAILFIHSEYYRDNMVLQDVIKVGEINE